MSTRKVGTSTRQAPCVASTRKPEAAEDVDDLALRHRDAEKLRDPAEAQPDCPGFRGLGITVDQALGRLASHLRQEGEAMRAACGANPMSAPRSKR